MNNQLIDMLVGLLQNIDYEESFNNLSVDNQNIIIDWYTRYHVLGKFSQKDALELMVYFYNHENLDIMVNTEFIRIRDHICQIYNIISDEFLNMFVSFRRMIWG